MNCSAKVSQEDKPGLQADGKKALPKKGVVPHHLSKKSKAGAVTAARFSQKSTGGQTTLQIPGRSKVNPGRQVRKARSGLARYKARHCIHTMSFSQELTERSELKCSS